MNDILKEKKEYSIKKQLKVYFNKGNIPFSCYKNKLKIPIKLFKYYCVYIFFKLTTSHSTLLKQTRFQITKMYL